MTLIDFQYKEFTSIVTVVAVAPTQHGRSIVHLLAMVQDCIQDFLWGVGENVKRCKIVQVPCQYLIPVGSYMDSRILPRQLSVDVM